MSESLQVKEFTANEEKSVISRIILFLLCTMLVFSTVAFGAVDFWALGINAFFAGLLIIFWTVEALRKKEFRFNTSALQIPLIGLILIGLIQLLPLRSVDFSPELLSIPADSSLSLAPYPTRLAIVQLAVYFIFFAAAQTFINNEKRLRLIVVTIIIFGSLMAFLGILFYLANAGAIYGLRQSSQAMPFASFINRHHFAAFMEMTIGLSIGLLLVKKAVKSDKRIFLLTGLVVMGIALVLTGSRGGIVSLLAVVAFAMTINARRKDLDEADTEITNKSKLRRNTIYVGGTLILFLILFGSVAILGGEDLLLRALGVGLSGDVSTGRFHFWQIGWSIFLDYPIFGAGLDSFGTMFPTYDSWNGVFRVEQTHNDYLQTLADTGILGFACVAAFIYLLFKKSSLVISKASTRFGRSAAIGALAGCFGILVHSFFDFPLRTSANMFFFLTLSLIATNLIAPQKKSHKTLDR